MEYDFSIRYEPGQRVQVRWKGKWLDGVIRRFDGLDYVVAIDDPNDPYRLCQATVSQLRPAT